MARVDEVRGVKDEAKNIWLAGQIDQLDEDNRADHAALRKTLTAIQTTLIGILVSTTTAAILLAVNLAVGG